MFQKRPLKCLSTVGPGIYIPEERKVNMKYLVAWGLGVPGVLIVIWFLINHL